MIISAPSRFEELPDDPAPIVPAALVDAPPPNERVDQDEGLSDHSTDEDDDTWWTPSELRLGVGVGLTADRLSSSDFNHRLQDLLEHAQTLKQQGNTEFGQGRWEMALETYREGLKELPVRRTSVKGKEKALPPREDTVAPSVNNELDEEAETEELCELRAILSANVAACLLKLNRWKDAVKACDDALEDKADYAKAIHRRALANEAIGSWGSLSASLEDFNKLAALPGNSPLLAQQIKQAQARLPGKIEMQQAKEKEEVVDKLKDLGNMVLGKFGLSTDNFKLQEQPGGGYGISFQR
ncbi:hypothetical protein JCM3770_005126 [Rhodotorula araucariae]